MQYAIQNKNTGKFAVRGYGHHIHLNTANSSPENSAYFDSKVVALFDDLTNAKTQRTRLVNQAIKREKANPDEMSNDIWRVVEVEVVAGRAVA